MEKMGLNELRERFLSFYESKGHYRLKSFPLVPQSDHSLLLINAGMAPLKPFFTGEQTPPAPRACSCQKCIRTPDIENVGKDARHGTFFEMLGNFSFGDYFKKEACTWAWEFLTHELHLPEEKLYVTVFQDDDEAWDIWENVVGVPAGHISRMGREDNFWEIGSGPCGPCSEIYYDRGEKYSCGKPTCSVGCDCDRYVEFWNLVFTQFDSDGKGSYTPLKKKNIDTGMGIERLACIMQGTDSIFEVDTIKNILNRVSEITGAAYGKNAKTDVSLRIITDHVRSCTMMICDGVMPSNMGRGYVLRRLLRRAARHGRLLGMREPFLTEVCEQVIHENEGAYPELREKEQFIKAVMQTEEERFGSTVESGLMKLEEMAGALMKAGRKILSGDDAFRLYDTEGFPIDLTVEILGEQGLSVDRPAFDELMQAQRTRAKKARGDTSELGWEGDELNLASLSATKFVGYDCEAAETKALALIRGGALADSVSEGDECAVITEETPFYAESGGQVADFGVIRAAGAELAVLGVQKDPQGHYLHQCRVVSGELSTDETVVMQIDGARRAAVRRAHSATHLLQKALREVLGAHVEQSGSLVEPDRLRFDFSHFSAVTEEELRRAEDMVNQTVLLDLPVMIREMPIEDAKKLGAMALFGEKYGKVVRVVRMGDYSTEFCGGTHVESTGRIGCVRLVSESSVAAGVRRVEAVTGMETLNLMRGLDSDSRGVAELFKTGAANLRQRAQQVLAELREANRQNEMLQSRLSALKAVELFNYAQEMGGVRVVSAKLDETGADALRGLSDMIRDKAPNMVCVLASVADGKILFAAACGKEAVKKGAHAGNILKKVAGLCGGGGGGRPDSATAGGRNVDALETALEQVNNIVAEMLK